MPRIEHEQFEDFDGEDDNSIIGNFSQRREKMTKPDKAPPKAKTNKLPELDGALTIYVSPEPKNNRVVTKLDKESPLAIFAAKNIQLSGNHNVLVFTPDPGTVGLVLASLHTDCEFSFLADNPNRRRLLERNIEANAEDVYNIDVVSSEEVRRNKPDLIVYSPESHIGLEAIDEQIREMRSLLSIGGEVVLLTHKKAGGSRHMEMFARTFGQDQVIEEKSGMGGYTLARARKVLGVEQDREETTSAVTFSIFGRTISAETAAGLFSREGLDEGTRLLLESAEDEIGNAKRVLDLGCSWGAIGLAVASVNQRAEIDMIDVDPRAIRLAQKNIKDNGFAGRVEVLLSADPRELSGDYDLVVSNPPFHEKESLLIELFQNTKSAMTKGGEVFIVVEDTYLEKFESIMKGIFGSVREHTKSGNYTVLLSRK